LHLAFLCKHRRYNLHLEFLGFLVDLEFLGFLVDLEFLGFLVDQFHRFHLHLHQKFHLFQEDLVGLVVQCHL
jgi:hypothetical protein